ncbi:MAG: glycosyltransferase [Sphingobium sp.]
MVHALYLICAISAIAFLHPYVTYPLSLRLMKQRSLGTEHGPRPSASLLFSCYNEESVLPTKLDNLAAIKALHPDIDILAYADQCSDNSLAILQARPDLLRVIAATERTGKAMGMRTLVQAAKGEICIFTDANVTLDPQSVGRLLDYFRIAAVGGVAGTLHYVNDDSSATAGAGGLYWRLEESIKALESRCGSIMGADGSIFATRRALYPEVPPHLLDDMTASISVMLHDRRLISAPNVIAFERNVTMASEEFRRKRRIACRAFNTHRHLWPQLRQTLSRTDRYKYVSHKLLRWFGLPFLTVGVAAGSLALWLDGAQTLLALLWGAMALVLVGAIAGVKICATLMSIMAAIAATFFGIIDAWRGKTYQIWSPAQSRN